MVKHALSPVETPDAAPHAADAAAPEAVNGALVGEAGDRAPDPEPQFAHIDERRVYNPSGMQRRRNVLTRLSSRLAFRKVAFDERHVRTIRDLARDGDVVYVMNHHSRLDFLYFNFAFLRFALPLAYFAHRLTMTPTKPFWRIILHGLRRLFGYYKHRLDATDRLAFALERHKAALLFLKRRSIWPWQTADRPDNTFLERVIASQQARIAAAPPGTRARPITIIPQLLVWTHNPKRYRKTFWTTVFGNPEAPGRFRKVLNFLMNRRRAFVQVGKPIDLVTFLTEPDADEADGSNASAAHTGEDVPVDELARTLRYQIHRALSLEEKVIKGPVLKRSKQLREEILGNPRVKALIGDLAKVGKTSEKALTKEVRGYLKEMAADFSMTYIEVMCILMTVVFSRLYSEMVVDQAGLERVREAGRKAPLVLLPCHRSHIDYLVLSYMFYANGLIPPHIAAGKNLNFFPVGKIFRRCGAFFLRRSFRDNPSYSLAFREYLRKLVKEGYWIEFFIEGGRSRTGKMLPPKFGMLRIIVDAIRSGAAPDVYFVPIYVGYEQIIEERAFTKELGGGKKKKENITALLNATQVLWSKYGRLYVNCGVPISCREALDQTDDSGPDADEDEKRRFLHRMGYRVSAGINDVAVVTPSSLAAMALLLHDKRGVSRTQLLARAGFLLELANQKKAPISRTLQHALRIRRQEIALARQAHASAENAQAALAWGEANPLAIAKGEAIANAIDEVLAHLAKEKHAECHTFDDDVVYAVAPERRINLDFYKNNIVHLFVSEAIVAAAIRSTIVMGMTTLRRVTEAAAVLSRTFKYEFVFDPDKGFAAQFGETLTRFEAGGLIQRKPGVDFADVKITMTELGAGTMSLFHRILQPWLEAYWLLARSLDRHANEPVSEAALLKDAQQRGQRRFHVGDVACPEAASSVNFSHALNAFEEFGFLSRVKKGRDRLVTCEVADGEESLFSDLAGRLRRYFA